MRTFIINTYFTVALFILFTSLTKAQHIHLLSHGKSTSIRGLSVVSNKIAWISGSNGYIALTTNGSKTWKWQQVKGFGKADFRDIEAFSDKRAIIMSSGIPALILKTIDGGSTWQLKYRNADTAYFLDAMDFVDINHGFILGDPINNKFVLLETKDGGETWDTTKNRPNALSGEAAFAASGTCIRISSDKKLFITTGGPVAKIDNANLSGTWNYHSIPILSGQSSKGSFSVSISSNVIIAVGGDYRHDKRSDSTACYSFNKGITWKLANKFPAGYQSCVEFIKYNRFISTGTSGTNITADGGKTWRQIDTISFNVCKKAKHGTLVLLAGNDGKIGVLKP